MGRASHRAWSRSAAAARPQYQQETRQEKTPAGAGVFLFPSERPGSGRDLGLVLARLAQHIAAAPHRLDVVLAARSIGELLAQLADEDVDDLQLRLIHAAIEMIEEH